MALFPVTDSMWILLTVNWVLILVSASWCPHDYVQQSSSTTRKFEQRTDRFWEFHEQSNTWVEVKLPYDLISCINDNCTKVGSIHQIEKSKEEKVEREDTNKSESLEKDGDGKSIVEEGAEIVLSRRKRVSLTRMSETSIWVTGQSGSIYERFWNGVHWVTAPHDLPISAGHAIHVFIVNQTILALSEAGILYQMQLNENAHPIWVELAPSLDQTTKASEQSSVMPIKSGVVSNDGVKIYFCTRNGSLLELGEVDPPRWINHGRPPGANVAAIADAASIRPEIVYTISSTGDLYEYDRSSKPSWKKHIWTEGATRGASLMPSAGCALHGLSGDSSVSLFLLTKGGKLVERRLHQRKWKWIFHESPKDQHLTSITPVLHDESDEKVMSLFFTTSVGSVFEYRMPRYTGISQAIGKPEAWLNHMHPPHAKAARGISGLQIHVGRVLFPLDDGRLAELHLPGLGGEDKGPNHPINFRRKASAKYMWSILEVPETEGWNAEYCKEERGPMNCIAGTKDESNDSGTRSITRRRKGSQALPDYLLAVTSKQTNSLKEYKYPDNWISSNFRLRMINGGRSFFLITDDGLTFEYLYTENVWLWLRHDHSTPMKGAVGTYNGSLFLVDKYGSLLMRERSETGLEWLNCTSMKKARQIVGGPPWDGIPGKAMKVTAEDALFFVSKTGRLLQFTVALRRFQWKDCQNPPNAKVASIVDQELFRENIVFVIGSDGRLYQYNKITELWHEHHQSQHLILSRLPGTAVRPLSLSSTGSLFMLSVDGGLVEYQWNPGEGWNWVEHGTPNKGVTLITSPSPCFEGNQLFLIGSDGKVYVRYMDQSTWKWKNCGFPHVGKVNNEDEGDKAKNSVKAEVCIDKDFATSLEKGALNFDQENCDPKVASTRPIPFSEDSVIFELRDGRLAEMRRVKDTQWAWSRTIGTPTSTCIANYWTAVAS